MRILMIDNYDSFTYNLVYILRNLHADVDVVRNDAIALHKCSDYDGIILSPGPGLPENAGKLKSVIATCSGQVPILGVCLGHQAIAEHLGSELILLNEVYHGVQSNVILAQNSSALFFDMPKMFLAGRYHAWVVPEEAHANFDITAMSNEGHIMAIENSERKLFGIQFHPESVLTPNGDKIVANFLRVCED